MSSVIEFGSFYWSTKENLRWNSEVERGEGFGENVIYIGCLRNLGRGGGG